MNLRITAEGKFDSVWKPIPQMKPIEIEWPDGVPVPPIPLPEQFKQTWKGWFGIKATAIERIRVEVVG